VRGKSCSRNTAATAAASEDGLVIGQGTLPPAGCFCESPASALVACAVLVAALVGGGWAAAARSTTEARNDRRPMPAPLSCARLLPPPPGLTYTALAPPPTPTPSPPPFPPPHSFQRDAPVAGIRLFPAVLGRWAVGAEAWASLLARDRRSVQRAARYKASTADKLSPSPTKVQSRTRRENWSIVRRSSWSS